jgi:hypothetical protein
MPLTMMQQAPRRTRGLLSSLFGPLMYAADDVVEEYRRPARPKAKRSTPDTV